MKKVLLIGLILAICILAFPQGVMAAGSDTAEVTASIDSIADIVATFTATPWALTRLATGLTPNLNPNAITVTVDCNNDWDVTVADTKVTDKGYMVSASKKLTDPFYLEDGQGTGIFATLTGVAWITESGNSQPLTTYYYDVYQQVENVDDAAEGSYSITITYTLVTK
jgi:hypothetical protein